MRLIELKRLIRRVLTEDEMPSGAETTSTTKGFYPYEIERGTDIHGFWYKSPGRAQGTDGDPGRPADAAEYIGLKTKGATPADASAELAPPDNDVPGGEG